MSDDRKAQPIIYLDVDDTLLMFPRHGTKAFYTRHPEGKAAPHAAEFVRWALEHFDVRWLTMWAPHGVMNDDSRRKLERLLGMYPGELIPVENPIPFFNRDAEHTTIKTNGIDWQAHASRRAVGLDRR